ncbi:MAG: esterase family protein [Bacteroidetes bacterium]|nr:esterase family protein [Bacteroidota bacterium]
MRKLMLLALLTLPGLSIAFSANGLRIQESLVMHSRILNQDIRFSVCLPQDYYSAGKSFPVVYLLHGLGDDETAWLEYGQISQYADKAVAEKMAVPMIFVMPQGFRSYYVNDYKGTFLYEDMFVKELVPYIDSIYRTLPDSRHRALMGYSMGGFGALNLHLKHPDVFGSTVPLSISIRTDKQYMTEDSSGWNKQWGRLFGGVGTIGEDRITEYYKQNSPFHLLPGLNEAQISKLNIYIDNGDKEQTLCRSNEELHILMRKLNIPHEFRVRDGGHSFQYWCSALPEALRFISDAFEGKSYQPDIQPMISLNAFPEKQVMRLTVQGKTAIACVPSEYDLGDRLYPVIYFIGELNTIQQKSIAALVGQEADDIKACPMILVFLPGAASAQFDKIMPELEQKLRIRKGYKFRALMGYQASADAVSALAIKQGQFGCCILSDGFLSVDSIAGLLSGRDPKSLESTSFYIDSPDKGNHYEGNGTAHMLLRDKDLSHEYRVRPGSGGFEWLIQGLPDIISFATKRFHK